MVGGTGANFGVLTDQYLYSPYGVEEPLTGSGNPFRYTGRYYDAETGLYYYRSRYYDPGVGRMGSPDSILYEGGLNLYNYGGGDPINNVDPLGTCGVKKRIDGCVVTGSKQSGKDTDIKNINPRSATRINTHAIIGNGGSREADFTKVDLSDLGASLQKFAAQGGSGLNNAILEAVKTGEPVQVSINGLKAGGGFGGRTSASQKGGIGRFAVNITGSVTAKTGEKGIGFQFVGGVTGVTDRQDFPADSRRTPTAALGTALFGTVQNKLGGNDFNITFFNTQTIDLIGKLPKP